MADQLVTLWRYRDLPEALVAKSKLDSDAVLCFLADPENGRVNWFLSNAVGGVRLQVADEDAEHAMALLSEEIPAGFTAEEIGEAYQQPDCSKVSVPGRQLPEYVQGHRRRVLVVLAAGLDSEKVVAL